MRLGQEAGVPLQHRRGFRMLLPEPTGFLRPLARYRVVPIARLDALDFKK
jgi:hypothetical protein